MLAIGYNTALVKEAPTSWKALMTSTSFAVSTDWPEGNVAIAALIAGVPSADIFNLDAISTPAVKANLAYLAKKSARKWTGVDDAKTLKGLQLATSYGFAMPELEKQGETWGFVEPQEGALGYIDSLAIPTSTKAELRPLALAFIAELIRSDAQALMTKNGAGWPVTDAARALLTPAEAKAAHLDDPDMLTKKLLMLKPLDTRTLNGINRLWDEANH